MEQVLAQSQDVSSQLMRQELTVYMDKVGGSFGMDDVVPVNRALPAMQQSSKQVQSNQIRLNVESTPVFTCTCNAVANDILSDGEPDSLRDCMIASFLTFLTLFCLYPFMVFSHEQSDFRAHTEP